MGSTSSQYAARRFRASAKGEDTVSVNVDSGVAHDTVEVLKDRIAVLEKEISSLTSRSSGHGTASVDVGDPRLLLAAMFHEMRGPLQGVIARTRLIERYAGPGVIRDEAEAIREEVRLAMAQAQRTAEIMGGGDLASRACEDVEVMSPAALLERTARMLGPRLRCGNVLLIDPRACDTDVTLEPLGITQILGIAIDNADRHTRDDRILLNAVVDPEREMLTFLVEDHGKGIPARELPHVFDPFIRGEDATTEHVRGFGLGLSIARCAARAMDGTITLDSVEGQGTTLRLEVPWRDVIPDRAEIVPRKAAVERLLLVDDDDGMARLMTRVLEMSGYCVVRARNGEEAFRLLREECVHRVISDHRMPGGSGLELMLRWPEIRDPQTPMLILSGQVPPDVRAQYEAHGVTVALKPIDTPMLYRLLNEAGAPQKQSVECRLDCVHPSS